MLASKRKAEIHQRKWAGEREHGKPGPLKKKVVEGGRGRGPRTCEKEKIVARSLRVSSSRGDGEGTGGEGVGGREGREG